MKELIEKMKRWTEDIQFDIKSEWPTEEEKNQMNSDLLAIKQAIGLLQDIENNNIDPQKFK